MNVYRRAYDPEKYHIGSTKSVLVRLDRDVLRLSIPKTNILKQSSWNETKIEPTFISQEMYNIAGNLTYLLQSVVEFLTIDYEVVCLPS